MYFFATIPNASKELGPLPAALEPDELDPISNENNFDFSFCMVGMDEGPEKAADPKGPDLRDEVTGRFVVTQDTSLLPQPGCASFLPQIFFLVSPSMLFSIITASNLTVASLIKM